MSDHDPSESSEPGPAAGSGGELPHGAIAPEVSRRVSTILDAVEREAARLRDDATEEARRYLDYSRRRADELVEERRRRIAELSDEIITKSEAVVARLDDAAPVRQGFENLVRSLGDAAERLARESEEHAADFQPPTFHDEAVRSYRPEPPGPPPAPSPPPRAPTPQAPQPGGAAEPPAPHQAPPPGPAPPPPAFGAEQGPQPHPARAAQGPAAVPHAAREQQPAGQDLDAGRMVAIQMAAAGRTRREVREHLHAAMGLADTRRILDELFGQGSPEDARVPWTSLGG